MGTTVPAATPKRESVQASSPAVAGSKRASIVPSKRHSIDPFATGLEKAASQSGGLMAGKRDSAQPVRCDPFSSGLAKAANSSGGMAASSSDPFATDFHRTERDSGPGIGTSINDKKKAAAANHGRRNSKPPKRSSLAQLHAATASPRATPKRSSVPTRGAARKGDQFSNAFEEQMHTNAL